MIPCFHFHAVINMGHVNQLEKQLIKEQIIAVIINNYRKSECQHLRIHIQTQLSVSAVC